MKQLAVLFILFCSLSAAAQDDSILKAFDFWIGTWEAKWKAPDGTIIKAENVIVKSTNGKVIEENFSDTTNSFFGKSISVFSPADSLWHQAWADNSGGYIDMVGIVEEDLRIFQTKPVTVGDKVVIRRMIFYNITPASFTWDWEISQDGGESWKLAWQIKYTRKN